MQKVSEEGEGRTDGRHGRHDGGKGDGDGGLEEKAAADADSAEGHLERRRNHDGE